MHRSSSLLIALTAVGLAGCGSNVISKADVESGSRLALTENAGKQAPPISCPSDLDANVGAKMVCAITLDGNLDDVTVQVASIDGSTARYNVQVADAPRSS